MIVSLAVLVLAGPCLILVMAAVSLLIVHHRLSHAPHALMWAAAFALGAAQWAIVAASITPANVLDVQTLSVDLTRLAALMLFVEGFRLRATGRWPGVKEAIVAIALLGLTTIASMTLPQIDSRAVMGILSGGLMAYAAWSVVPSARRRTVGEIAATGALAALAAARFALTIAALVDRDGNAVAVLQQLLVLPATAAEGLFAMLLIASDFSAVRHRLVHTDPLTGVLNRLGFEAAARSALRRARRPAHPVSLAIADIDRFKAINDAHGHTIGDHALGRVARHFEAALGEEDIVGRIGGEEFAVLLWGDSAEAALRRIEPLRTGVGGACADVAPELAVTVSFGIAEQARGEGLTSLLDRADRALYRSKGEGRDRSTLAEARV